MFGHLRPPHKKIMYFFFFFHRHREQTYGHQGGNRGVGWIGKLRLTYVHYYVWNVWPPDGKNWLIGKDSDAEETADEMVTWHHWLDGHEF